MNPGLIDTHAHLNFPDFEKDYDQVIKRAMAAGVKKIICASSSIDSSIKAIKIAKDYPEVVYASIGIHPQQTDPKNNDSIETQLVQLDKLANNKGVVAIGECGLDYSSTPPPEHNRTKAEQKQLFVGQIEIAIKYQLPLIIHSREAFIETVEILSQYKSRGVWHCYTGGKKGIAKVQALGYYFGLDGNLTYDEGLQNVARLIPIEKILLETDAPWLTPLPYRGSRNESAYLVQIANCLADLKQIPKNKLIEVLRTNSDGLFKI
jgi:TatD DNase family protein